MSPDCLTLPPGTQHPTRAKQEPTIVTSTITRVACGLRPSSRMQLNVVKRPVGKAMSSGSQPAKRKREGERGALRNSLRKEPKAKTKIRNGRWVATTAYI